MRGMRLHIFVVLLIGALGLSGCGADSLMSAVGWDNAGGLYVPDLLAKAPELNGQSITVDGAYVGRGGSPPLSVLALGVSTLDNGLQAEPLGEPIWLEGFPDIAASLHQPGDAIYGFVRINGVFETGSTYGPEQKYRHQIRVASAEPIERIQRQERRVDSAPLGDGKIGLLDLLQAADTYNGQKVTTQGYYFWNGLIYVLAEGVSTEEDGSNPQPIGKMVWMEGFPADESGKLHLGPNNSFVWGKVEVTGEFKAGGGFGKDAAYQYFLQVIPPAKALENTQN